MRCWFSKAVDGLCDNSQSRSRVYSSATVNESLCGPIIFTMKVWVATWDVGGTEIGFEVFADESMAVKAAIGYALEMSLLEDESQSVDDARDQLLSTGDLTFDDRQCYYSVSEREVIERN
jgi:hypothetical protein